MEYIFYWMDVKSGETIFVFSARTLQRPRSAGRYGFLFKFIDTVGWGGGVEL